ncbi:hypothetical protein F5Y04DRAFT_287890 [Hypomontagnella monticulosa]|nr:hypothetical protein F5Y04DRAFT_287890 [Hypomontagnella monticulosa]
MLTRMQTSATQQLPGHSNTATMNPQPPTATSTTEAIIQPRQEGVNYGPPINFYGMMSIVLVFFVLLLFLSGYVLWRQRKELPKRTAEINRLKQLRGNLAVDDFAGPNVAANLRWRNQNVDPDRDVEASPYHAHPTEGHRDSLTLEPNNEYDERFVVGRASPESEHRGRAYTRDDQYYMESAA